MSAKRWILDGSKPFFSKGRGRSHMISGFLVQHPSSPFFELNDEEWKKAIEKYPDFLIDDDVNYPDHSATAAINIGTDIYFDNDTVLLQFERPFKLLQFKTEYKDHQIEVLGDNARTHTAKQYTIHDFAKGVDTRCPVQFIEYIDENGNKQLIDCYFKRGPNKGMSKGLLEIAKELNVLMPKACKLDQLRSLLSQHRAFQNVSITFHLLKIIFFFCV